jgi:tRNA-splicing endonuclease subunit Sen34
MASNLPSVNEPFPISLISNRYLLFSIDAITYIRRFHHITGVLIGSIPQVPQQNVFLGIPLQLTPEEARLLVEKGAAFIVDDVRTHDEGLPGLSESARLEYTRGLKREGAQAAKLVQARKGEKTGRALERMEERKAAPTSAMTADLRESLVYEEEEDGSTESIFLSTAPTRASSLAPSQHTHSTSNTAGYAITPTTSYPPLPTPTRSSGLPLPKVPSSYPLFAHLHSHGYFISPGLRFGCQYLVYPGDPLRFHSHFLATGMQWDDEIDLLDLVGGGRLGTGVKKGYLIGGVEEEDGLGADGSTRERKVRTFCIEWGGM